MKVMMQSNYKPYSQYKDSGIEWLGEIPDNWQIIRTKYIASLIMGQSPKSKECNVEGIGYPFLQGNAEFQTINPMPMQYCENPRKIVHSNDILLSVRAPVGQLNIADQKYGIGRGLCGLRPNNEKMNIYYFWYLIHHVRVQLNYFSSGSTYDAVSVEDVGELISVIPCINEQTSIVSFLDSKTAQIDVLIEKKQRQIELLKEKRSALISHAVTKGLDPTVKTKDSGIEWLGEIPDSWRILNVKRTGNIVNGATPKSNVEEYWNGEITWFTPDDLGLNKSKYIQDSKRNITRQGYDNCGVTLFPPDSIILSTRAPIGHIAISKVSATINQGCRVIIPKKRVSSGYLFYLLYSLKEPLNIRGQGTTFTELSYDSLGSTKICLPKHNEQVTIASFLDTKTAQIDTLIDKVSYGIEKLKEYRSALITAAVTGKIDVRNLEH